MEKYLVFVVEDDEDDWLFLMEAFLAVGCAKEIRQFQTPQLLLKMLSVLAAGQLPDMIVLDHQTPGGTGSETVAEIRSKQSFDPISLVIYSTVVSPAMQEKLGRQGVDLCLQKGSTQQELVDHVQRFCDLLDKKQRAA